jgi:predicted ribosomally synthesized peptide with SipW-like signal peptide
MKRILLGIVTIALVSSMSIGATRAYFADTANVENNTFATGTLEIRVNGQPTIAGANFTDAAPGEMKVFQHNINNYGAPWFVGPSNLTAKSLLLNIVNPNDLGSGLWNQVIIKVEVNRGWPAWQVAYWGNINALSNVDLLHPNWSELTPGSSEDIRYTLYLPESGSDQSSMMGKTLTWDFVIEGRTN